MGRSVISFLTSIPRAAWNQFKSCCCCCCAKEKRIVDVDVSFELATKYTSGILLILACLAFANQFVRNFEIDCSTISTSANARGGYDDPDLNDFCWNSQMFIVAKGLEPAMRKELTYPGLSRVFDKEKDELIYQRSYKYVCLLLTILAFASYLPLFVWKCRRTEKIKSLTAEITPSESATEENVRVNYFLETIGFNNSFAFHYLGCKILSTLSPLLQWMYLCSFIGRRYKFYGIDIFQFHIDQNNPWPNPMDVVFPKMTWCEWMKYGYSGAIEPKLAQCQLPMNNLTQWIFFMYWLWLVFILLISAVSLFAFLIRNCTPYSKFQYQKLAQKPFQNDLELVNWPQPCKEVRDLTELNLNFGDFVVLEFMKKNLKGRQFREFVRRIMQPSVSKNNFI